MESDLQSLQSLASEVETCVERIMYADYLVNRCLDLMTSRDYGNQFSDETFFAIRDVFLEFYRENLSEEVQDLGLVTTCPLSYFE